jgi:hypothetical protein
MSSLQRPNDKYCLGKYWFTARIIRNTQNTLWGQNTEFYNVKQVVHMGYLVGKPEGKRPLGSLQVCEKVTWSQVQTVGWMGGEKKHPRQSQHSKTELQLTLHNQQNS